MTIRQRISTLALAGALAAGCLAALPTLTTTAAAQAPVLRNDPLASVATVTLADLGGDSAQFAAERDALAAQIATRLGLDPAEMQQAWARADVRHQRAVMAALSQLGVPYRRNTSIEHVGFDCSGLTTYAWAQAGVTLRRQSEAQIGAAAARTQATAQAGDLVWYPGHVMLYLGVGTAVVHSPYTGRTVEVTQVSHGRGRNVRYGDPTA